MQKGNNSTYNSTKKDKIPRNKFNHAGKTYTLKIIKTMLKELKTQVNGKSTCVHGLEDLVLLRY